MGNDDETEAQKRERRAAEKVDNELKLASEQEERLYLQEQEDIKQKGVERKQRGLGMKGGGRKGLMFNRKETGVPNPNPNQGKNKQY